MSANIPAAGRDSYGNRENELSEIAEKRNEYEKLSGYTFI